VIDMDITETKNNHEKRLLLTIAVGDVYQKIGKYTHPTLKRYADRIGADFMVIDKSTCSSPHWEKFQIFYLLNRYDRILYVDTDVIIRGDCPDLLGLVPREMLGAFNEAPFTERNLAMNNASLQYQVPITRWNGKYYNTGIMVISARHNHLFRKPGQEIDNFHEQSYLNLQIAKHGVNVYDLPYSFNRMSCMDRFTGEERFASYIIHYAGAPDLNMVYELIQKDMAKWDSDSPEYKYKRHILISVIGGLGDQICAEPAIRFMMNNVYPGDDIIILTHFPRIFQHLNLPVFSHDEFIPEFDTPYYHVLSLPGPEKPQWSIVSNLLCHTVDYCSIALLRRILPMADKRVQLTWDLDDLTGLIDIIGIRNVNELVLVHPGRHWESKTFPVEWWQEVIDGLYEAGLHVCIIGKNEDETRGTLDVIAREGMLDTRDRLELGALIALLANSKLLISNDSAPIHVAGAFDNYIILIPSCKHPEHILHNRNGSPYWRAKALYKRLALDDCDSRPTSGYSGYDISGEFLHDKYDAYLPEPSEVVAAACQFKGVDHGRIRA
jgi:hypothetical protein